MSYVTKIEPRERCAPGQLGNRIYAVNTDQQHAVTATVRETQHVPGQPQVVHEKPVDLPPGGSKDLGCSHTPAGSGTYITTTYEVIGEKIH